jgi:hypothetical protein
MVADGQWHEVAELVRDGISGGSPSLVSMSLFSARVYDVDALVCVTSADKAPVGSSNGERWAGGWLRSHGGAVTASGMAGAAPAVMRRSR